MNVLLEYIGIKEAGPVITYGMAKGLSENGINVYMILSNDIENKEQWLLNFSKEQLFFVETTPKKHSLISTSIKFIKDLNSIKKKFSNIRFDYVIRTFLISWDDIICKMVKSNDILNMIHDPVPHSSMNIREAKKYKKMISKSRKAIVLSRKFIPILEEEYGIQSKNIFYMRLGQMTFYDGSLNTVNQKVEKESNNISFLFFGRIDGYKGLHVLSKAYKLLSNEMSNVSLTIAGNGDFEEYENEYMNLNNVKIINRYIGDEEITQLFNVKNTVVILPYLDATQSGVIPLAFQFGVPVIASDSGGLKEQLFDGRVGIFVEAGNCEELYNAMKLFIIKPNQYKTEADQMKLYAGKLEWKVVTKGLIDGLCIH